MCDDAVHGDWRGGKRTCEEQGQHERHRAVLSDRIIEWWGEVGKTKFLEIMK